MFIFTERSLEGYSSKHRNQGLAMIASTLSLNYLTQGNFHIMESLPLHHTFKAFLLY